MMTMSSPLYHANSADSRIMDRFTPSGSLGRNETQRSPAVSLALALGAAGCLLASADEASLPRLGWTTLFLFLAVESEVRTLRTPLSLGLVALLVSSIGIAAGEGAHSLALALTGSILFPLLLLPLLAMGLLGAGTLLSAAVLGALWGPEPVLAVCACFVVLGTPFLISRMLQASNPYTLPLTTVLAYAAAIYQLM